MDPETRQPGRPRDETIDLEIVRSLFALVEEVGLGAVTIDAIAARAGVSKASIYRRWESKEELIVDAIAGLADEIEIPRTGSVREQMMATTAQIRSFMSDTTAGLVFPWLIGEIANGSDIGRRYAQTVILPRRLAVKQMIEQAIENGELRADLDPDLAVDMLTGPLILSKLIGPVPGSDVKPTESLVDALLEGWRRRS